jgi:hypothetical protein
VTLAADDAAQVYALLSDALAIPPMTARCRFLVTR